MKLIFLLKADVVKRLLKESSSEAAAVNDRLLATNGKVKTMIKIGVSFGTINFTQRMTERDKRGGALTLQISIGIELFELAIIGL